MKRLLGFIFIALAAGPSLAKTFKSQFISLELPPNWDCQQEEIDWVCQPDNIAERSEVIMIIVTKSKDEVDDVFEKYEKVLATEKDMRDLLGNSYRSEVKYVKRRTIGEHEWMDSLHKGSEIAGFMTRYVVSTKERVAGLITYSIAESAYSKWAEVMDRMIGTAQMYFDAKAFAKLQSSRSGSLLGKRSGGLKRFAPSLEEAQEEENKKGNPVVDILVGLLLVGAVVFVIWKKKQQKKG